MRPTALITGANRGLGLQTAKELAKRGFTVFAAARDAAAAGRAAAEVSGEAITLDVGGSDSVRRAAEAFGKRSDRLDVLVNNAGVYPDEGVTILDIDRERLAATFQTNTFGPVEVTWAFLPFLRKSSAPRVVNVSSGYGQLGGLSPDVPSYCLSKLALNGVTIMLAKALKADGVAVNSVCPGWVRTDMGGASADRSVEEGADGIVWLAADAPHGLTGKFFRDRKEIPWGDERSTRNRQVGTMSERNAGVKQAETFPDPADPVLYPRLSREQLARIESFAGRREYRPGEPLFGVGERDTTLFVLESGAAEIIDRRPDGDLCVARVPAGNFIGDIAMFTGEPTVVACVAAEPSRALTVSRDRLRELVARHSEIGDLLLTAFLARRAWLEGHGYGQVALVGSRSSQQAFRLREFLSRNQVPFRWYDAETDPASRALLERLGISPGETPVLVRGGGRVCRNPEVGAVADELGLRVDPGEEPYDLVVVGAGPAGLAAAVYGASEGLRTLVLDADSPGGQAGTSSKIENYLGFLTGISGGELTRQAVLQARKFGAVVCNPRAARRLEDRGDVKLLELDGGRPVAARCVIVATGAEYRRLECQRCREFEGRGVYYAASNVEAVNCAGEDVAIVGGGNSAEQAAVFLAGHARRVYLVVRKGGLADTMSRYLIDRVERTPNVELLTSTRVAALDGDDRLRAVEFEGAGAAPRRVDLGGLFVMIGATPRTGWLDGAVLLDDRGFVLTGDDLRQDARFAGRWPAGRVPYLVESSVCGVFAAGDVRRGSVKRVAAAVGEGSMAVTFAHRRLAELPARGS